MSASGPIDEQYDEQHDEQYGTLNPAAPSELARFAFLIGHWRCEAKIKSASGEWQTFAATWLGRFILDGYAIADEYRMTNCNGDLIVLGTNLRSYDASQQTWNIRWLSAFTGSWTDLASAELGGVHCDGNTIRYAFKEPVADHAYTRATYTPHSPTHFTWRGEQSDEATSWREFMIVEAYRTH